MRLLPARLNLPAPAVQGEQMSLAVLKSRALAGMEAPEVSVEVHLANGLPSFTVVGLPDTEVKESRERVRAALQNCGFDMPARRITVNLAPADLPKESARFDLPIALGILAASGQLPAEHLSDYEFAGELSLSGQLRPIRGALAMTFAMQQHGGGQRAFILPHTNASEAALVAQAAIFPAHTLLDVCAHFAARDRQCRLQRHQPQPLPTVAPYPDFADVRGQQQARRALEVAAAGGHHVMMIGPPGAGKTMLASRFPGILPPMSEQEALESAAVYSLNGNFKVENWKQRPFRAPHQTASGVALVGGGNLPRPGEISLAHCGVLFLDEIAEYSRKVLDVLRQPLESGRITISRAARQADFPARFQLIAAMNPCPCGYLGHASGRCRCTPEAVQRYHARLSGPMLDRIDLQIEVAALPPASLNQQTGAIENTQAIASRVATAHAIQLARQGKQNQQLGNHEIVQHCMLDQAGERLLNGAMLRLHWSARTYHRLLRVARSIADLAGSDTVSAAHMAEAIQYRRVLQEF